MTESATRSSRTEGYTHGHPHDDPFYPHLVVNVGAGNVHTSTSRWWLKALGRAVSFDEALRVIKALPAEHGDVLLPLLIEKEEG